MSGQLLSQIYFSPKFYLTIYLSLFALIEFDDALSSIYTR